MEGKRNSGSRSRKREEREEERRKEEGKYFRTSLQNCCKGASNSRTGCTPCAFDLLESQKLHCSQRPWIFSSQGQEHSIKSHKMVVFDHSITNTRLRQRRQLWAPFTTVTINILSKNENQDIVRSHIYSDYDYQQGYTWNTVNSERHYVYLWKITGPSELFQTGGLRSEGRKESPSWSHRFSDWYIYGF